MYLRERFTIKESCIGDQCVYVPWGYGKAVNMASQLYAKWKVSSTRVSGGSLLAVSQYIKPLSTDISEMLILLQDKDA